MLLKLKSSPGLPRASLDIALPSISENSTRPFCPSFLCTEDQALNRLTGVTAQQYGPLHSRDLLPSLRMPTSHSAPNSPQGCPESSQNSFPRSATLGFRRLCYMLSPGPILCHPFSRHIAQHSGTPSRIRSAALHAPPLLSEGGIISLPAPTALLQSLGLLGTRYPVGSRIPVSKTVATAEVEQSIRSGQGTNTQEQTCWQEPGGEFTWSLPSSEKTLWLAKSVRFQPSA